MSFSPVVTGGPGEGRREGGREVEHGPGQDHVVVRAEEEGDEDRAHPGPLEDGAELVQGTDGPPPGVLTNCQLHEQQGDPN